MPIFSINKEKYYKTNNKIKYTIYSDEKRGPNFNGLWVEQPFFQKECFWETKGCFPKSEFEMSEKDNTLLEIEVFKII